MTYAADTAKQRITNNQLTRREYVTLGLDAIIAERDEALRQLANANRINQEMAEATTKLERENARLKAQAPAELAGLRDDLSAAIGSIQFVAALQRDLLKETGSLARAATIRRRQVAKGYTPEHDDHHGERELTNAAAALAGYRRDLWPWLPEPFDELGGDPDRLLHAAALLCATQDVIDRRRKAKGNA
jgi:hypothetical protein